MPWFMRKGEGGVSPRSRLEKRRNIDTFFDSAWDWSDAIVVVYACEAVCVYALFSFGLALYIYIVRMLYVCIK